MPKLSHMVQPKGVKDKKLEVIDGYTIKYHANGATVWSKGKMLDDQPDGYWEWYRIDGTIKRSGHFERESPLASGLLTMIKEKSIKQPTEEKNSGGLKTCSARRWRLLLIGRLFF